MNVKQQADYAIAFALTRDNYTVALSFLDACHRMSAEFGTPVEDILKAANIKLAACVSNRSSIDN